MTENTATHKISSLKDCTPIKVEDAVNFMSKEVSVVIHYNFKSKQDLVVQIKNNKNYIDAERVKDVVGIGKKELTFNLKDGKLQTNFYICYKRNLERQNISCIASSS